MRKFTQTCKCLRSDAFKLHIYICTKKGASPCAGKLYQLMSKKNVLKEEWQSFWDTFESAVNRNTDISRIQKFTYLKSCVTGVAESAITGLPLTEDNYETAIDILRDRFGKPELLIFNHMDALLKLPIVSSVHETKKLRDLYDKIDRDKHSKFEGTRHRIRVLWKFISSSCNGENSF